MKAELVEYMGSDLSVVNAARVSFANIAIEVTPADEALIYFLARGMDSKGWMAQIQKLVDMTAPYDAEQFIQHIKHQATHWVPFAHPHITLRMAAPVPIRTQCFKHKLGFVESEESRRYIKSRPELHVPEFFRSSLKNVKQGSGGVHIASDKWLAEYIRICTEAIDAYQLMTENVVDANGTVVEYGVCPEQARFILPQGVIVNWIWTGSLAAFARYYNQRIDGHAQKESQILAAQVSDLIAPLFPVSWKALTRG